ncbi:MAG TPA: hypothetical protein VN808_19935 [Stellaceae bacterium]|nr:hypothetical protein [Stellaceae bacterium]
MKKSAIVLAAAAICFIGPAGVSFADNYSSCLRDAAQDAARCRYERFDADYVCRDLYVQSVDICRDSYHKWPRR